MRPGERIAIELAEPLELDSGEAVKALVRRFEYEGHGSFVTAGNTVPVADMYELGLAGGVGSTGMADLIMTSKGLVGAIVGLRASK